MSETTPKPLPKAVSDETISESASMDHRPNGFDQTGNSDIEKGPVSSSVPSTDTPAEAQAGLVDWDGPDDPALPRNWPARKKWTNVFLLASLTLLTPFASSMFAPSVDIVMKEFNDHNQTKGTLVVSVYLLGYAFGPLLLAPLSELYGRLVLYHVTTVLFILFNVACGKSTNFSMLIVFRVLTGITGSCPLTIGPGSIADMYAQEERGKIMAIWTLPILLGPSIGPIAGGYLSESLGWRWDFWFLVIVTSFVFLLCLAFLSETYATVLLESKARRLRKSTGDQTLKAARTSTIPPRELFLTSIIRPTKMLCTEPIVFGLSVVTAIVYGILYLLFTSIPNVFEDQYSFPVQNTGLAYLGPGIGQMIGVTVFGMVSDSLLKRLGKGGELKPEYRLPPLLVGTCLITTGLIWYGWTTYFEVMWMVPIIGLGFVGAGVITSFLPVSTYLVDAYTEYAASATAANTVLRSIGGALLPLCGSAMYDRLGLGWGTTLLAFITLANFPLVFFFIKKGEQMRSRKTSKNLAKIKAGSQ